MQVDQRSRADVRNNLRRCDRADFAALGEWQSRCETKEKASGEQVSSTSGVKYAINRLSRHLDLFVAGHYHAAIRTGCDHR